MPGFPSRRKSFCGNAGPASGKRKCHCILLVPASVANITSFNILRLFKHRSFDKITSKSWKILWGSLSNSFRGGTGWIPRTPISIWSSAVGWDDGRWSFWLCPSGQDASSCPMTLPMCGFLSTASISIYFALMFCNVSGLHQHQTFPKSIFSISCLFLSLGWSAGTIFCSTWASQKTLWGTGPVWRFKPKCRWFFLFQFFFLCYPFLAIVSCFFPLCHLSCVWK